MTIEIVCIKKDGGNHSNPHEAISDFHWVSASDTKGDLANRETLVNWLLKQGNEAYVDGGGNVKAYCKVVNNGRIRFVQTYSDDRPTNNLLQLEECKHF